jgi:hypothetical protein
MKLEDRERLHSEITALEWLKMIVYGGPDEWHAWSLI